MAKTILKFLLKTLMWIAAIVILIVLLIALFIKFHPVFGGTPDAVSWEKIKNSPNFNGTQFVNLTPTNVMTTNASSVDSNEEKFSLLSLFFPPEGKRPSQPLPSVKLDKNELQNNSFVWLGHSTLLIKEDNQTILVDPVFYRASPVSFVGNPYAIENPITIDDLPEINVVLITHDHYDHLDYEAIKKLSNDVDQYIVPLGVKAHLQRWGIDDSRIEEIDWYGDADFGNIAFTLVPSQHFSGRSFNNRNSSLWGGYVIGASEEKVFVSGDGGYSPEFKKIGEKFGPFDIAFMEDGAYSSHWSQIHMMPEESVQAGIDVNAKVLVPIHWAKFDLAPHRWSEPIERFVKSAAQKDVNIATPLIGEVFKLDDLPTDRWWE